VADEADLQFLDPTLSELARQLEPHDFERIDPPADLWARIEAATQVEAGLPPGRSASVTVLRPAGPTRRRRYVAAIAGAIAIAAGIVVAVAVSSSSGTGARVVASAPLSNQGLASFPVTPSGDARLVTHNGATFVELSVKNAPAEAGTFLEVWLIDRGIKGMVSLGPYNGNGSYRVPAAVAPGDFPVVDVSVQKVDGKATHSGVSVVRGTLPVGAAVN
jgi:hypothetical protein